MNYYQHHLGDYAKDTAHLSLVEEGAYRRMLDLYYVSERQLPKDRSGLYRLVRAKSREEKLAVDTVLGEFFIETNDGWSHNRCDQEIAKAKEKSAKAAASAGKRWQCEQDANAMRTHSEGNAPNNPVTSNKEKNKENPPADAGPVWNESLSILTGNGVSEKSARGFLGLLCRDYAEVEIVEAVKSSMGKINPTAYVKGFLKERPKKNQPAIKVDV